MSKDSGHMAAVGFGAFNPLNAIGLRHINDLPTHAHQLIKRGISSELIEPVSQHLGLDKEALAQLMGLGRGQVNRMSTKKLSLPAHAVEVMLRLIETHDMAVDVFGSRENASAWLSSPHPLLDNECPRSAMKTAYGTAQVKDLLVKTKYGGVV